jgi:hypothetical protein
VPCDGGVHGSGDAVLDGDVTVDEIGSWAQLLGGLEAQSGVDVRDDYGGTLLDELMSRGLPKTTCSSSYQCNLPF